MGKEDEWEKTRSPVVCWVNQVYCIGKCNLVLVVWLHADTSLPLCAPVLCSWNSSGFLWVTRVVEGSGN